MLKGVQDTRTTPQAYVDALRTWLLEEILFCDVLVSQLHPFYDAYPHFRGQAKKRVEEEAVHRGFFGISLARGRLHDDSLSR